MDRKCVFTSSAYTKANGYFLAMTIIMVTAIDPVNTAGRAVGRCGATQQ